MKTQSTIVLLLLFIKSILCWVTPPLPNHCRIRKPTSLHLINLGEWLSGGSLASVTSLPYDPPLGNLKSDTKQTFAIQERFISFTGEDFDVWDVDENRPFCKVRGALLHLPGKDKMRLTKDGSCRVTLDRKLVAFKPTYDIYRNDSGDKVGWIEKKTFALTDSFDVFVQGQGGPFSKPAYTLEGDFLDRRFVMKNTENKVVAKVTKDQLIEFDAFNHYQVQVAPGMDAMLVLACACAIDEEFDEERQKKQNDKQ